MIRFRLRPLTLKRLQRFKRIKRGYYSFLILSVLILISLFCELIANNKPILLRYEGEFYFPALRYYPAHRFGLVGDREPNYREMAENFDSSKGFIWMPPIPYSPNEYDFDTTERPPSPPSKKHLLGTDDRGRDVLVRLLYGFRIAIFFSLFLTLISQAIGAVIGSFMGYFGGRFDLYFQRFIEIWSNIPYLYLVIILASIFQPNFWTLLLIMVAFGWINLTYYMRTEMYREKAKDYCMAAQAIGSHHPRIMFVHLFPNSLIPLITLFPFQLISGIGSLTALDFLGYGLPPPTPSWGELMKQSLEHLDKFWLSLSPFIAITVTLLLVTFIGEAVREAFDPKEYSHYN